MDRASLLNGMRSNITRRRTPGESFSHLSEVAYKGNMIGKHVTAHLFFWGGENIPKPIHDHFKPALFQNTKRRNSAKASNRAAPRPCRSFASRSPRVRRALEALQIRPGDQILAVNGVAGHWEASPFGRRSVDGRSTLGQTGRRDLKRVCGRELGGCPEGSWEFGTSFLGGSVELT